MGREGHRTAKLVAKCNPQWKRKLGTPVNTWKAGIRESM
jgi:hypothetical protein